MNVDFVFALVNIFHLTSKIKAHIRSAMHTYTQTVTSARKGIAI